MDPEKFDRVLLDVLYGEADDVTRAAAERHMNQSERARRTFDDLRAAREVGQMPLVDAPLGLEARILAAERAARSQRSLGTRLGGIVSLVASYTMRPQMGMAALLLLMLGSSLLLLRARPGAHDNVQVTERGVPESEVEPVTVVPVTPPREGAGDERRREERRAKAAPPSEAQPAAPPPATASPARDEAERDDAFAFPTVRERSADKAAAKTDGPSEAFEGALLAYTEGRYAEAERRFDEVARSSDPSSAKAELYAARAAQRSSGCGSAIERFEAVATRHVGTELAHEASWGAAECYRQLGNPDKAASTYRELLEAPAYAEKAQRALAAMSEPATATSEAPAAAAGRAAPTKASKPAASKPAATQSE